MHKYYRISGLFLFMLALCVCGCSGSTADPMGTGTVQFVSESISSTGTASVATVITTAQCAPNTSLTLTAWVSNYTNDGKLVPVIGESVTFTLDTPENGARLTVLNNKTAGNGQARVAYMAGNNLFPDVVRVTTGVGATASITITKTGTTPRGAVVSLPTGPLTVTPLGLSTITATVTDNGLVVQGERVTFTLLTNNGASLSVTSGLTNAAGQVITTYQAGNNMNQDVVQASLANGATAQVTMNKSGAAPGRAVTLVADPTSVTPLGFSVLTATVKDSGSVVKGELVNFAIRTDNGAYLSTTSGYSDANGTVVTVYTAGNNTASDDVTAWLQNGSTAEAVITKSGVPSTVSITMKADPAAITITTATPLTPPKATSAITATLKDTSGAVISGVTIHFTAQPGGTFDGDTLKSIDVTTGVDGNAVTLFKTAGGGEAGAGAGSYVIKAASQDASAAVSISVTYSAP
jgi:hypothetical protein